MLSAKKTMIAAAGNAGGGGGWVLELIETGTSPNFALSKVVVDSNGDAIIAATDNSTFNMYVCKVDTDGALVWSKEIDAGATPRISRLSAITVDSSDNIIIVGGYDQDGGSSAYRETSYIIKLNSSGVKQWSDNLRYASFGEWLSGVVVDGSDNIYVCASMADDANSYEFSGYVIKFNSAGTQQWNTRLYDSADYNYLNGIVLDTSGNIYVAGHGQGESGYDTNFRPTTMKLDSSGTLQFDNSFNLGIATNIFGYGLAIDSANNIYANGENPVATDLWVAKYNSAGTEQWRKKLTLSGGIAGSEASHHSNTCMDSSDNVYIVNTCTTTPQRGNVTSFDSSGSLRWSIDFEDTSATLSYNLYGCFVDANDNLFLSGRKLSATASDRRIILVKVPSSGNFTGVYGDFTFSDVGNSAVTETYSLVTRSVLNGSLSNKGHANPSETTSTPSMTETLTTI